MGRTISPTSSISGINSTLTSATKAVGAGYMGEFGTGLWRVFGTPGTYSFTVPAGITQLRVRGVGGGGGGGNSGGGQGGGGGGGGYAHGVFLVAAGTTYNVTVGSGGGGQTAGGTTSFGALLSAIGGSGGTASAPGIGGSGVGGDFQATGGRGGNIGGFTGSLTGGGAAGSQLGDGGHGGDSAFNSSHTGGGGVGGGDGANTVSSNEVSAGGGPFGIALPSGVSGGSRPAPNIIGDLNNGTQATSNPINAVIRFPFDCFTGGGGDVSNTAASNAGIGGGGGGNSTPSYGNGGVGGGGGGYAGRGGIGGGSGANGLSGGNGLVVVEW